MLERQVQMATAPKLATRSIARCPRCYCPIVRGAKWETIGSDVNGPIYAHYGCKPPGQKTPEPIQEAEEKPDPLAKDEKADSVIAEVESRLLSKMQQMTAAAARAAMPEIRKLAVDQTERAVEQIAAGAESRIGQAEKAVETAVVDTSAQVNAKLGQLQREADETLAQVRSDSSALIDALEQKAMDEIRARVDEHAVKLVRHVFVVKNGEEERELDADQVYHEAFPEVLELVMAGFNVFIPGPTGAGKTHMARQVAEALELEFGLISGTAGTTESEILGTSIPNISTGENVYIETEFVRLYENGGLFLLDEGDAMDPNCLLKINAAIANGYCPVPKRHAKPIAKRHEKFAFLMAANTFGNGANRQYCGRNKLDEATLDRFRCATVPIDYSEAIELRAVQGDQELYNLLCGWRRKIVEKRFQRVLSTRFMVGAWILKHQLGKDDKYIAARLTGGWTQREAEEVVGEILK